MRVSGDGSIANVGIAQSSINEYSPELNFHLEGCLATEASMVVLDTLELIVQVFIVWLEQLGEMYIVNFDFWSHWILLGSITY